MKREEIISDLKDIRQELMEGVDTSDFLYIKFQINKIDTLLYKLADELQEPKDGVKECQKAEEILDSYPKYTIGLFPNDRKAIAIKLSDAIAAMHDFAASERREELIRLIDGYICAPPGISIVKYVDDYLNNK